ncbi:MAG: type IV secretory system conjugative DNA transfer family protein, partial [Acidimicrobiales bacterium]
MAGRLVAAEARAGVCVVGPSQSGKTSGLCVPLMLEARAGGGAVIASSVKGDLYDATLYRRASLGQVKVFDPTCSVVVRSATWSPLRAARTATGAQAAARALIEVAGKDGLENSDFWMETAGDLLWPLMFVASHTEATMADVVRWITTHDRPITNLDGALVHQGEVDQLLAELE